MAYLLTEQLLKDLEVIADTSLFDEEWYRKAYPEIEEIGISPKAHYLLLGEKELRNPSKQFSTEHYWTLYPDVKKSGMSALIHYLEYGEKEGRQIKPMDSEDLEAKLEAWEQQLLLETELQLSAPDIPLVSVILPTKNRAGFLGSAIESVLEQTYLNWELLIIDDHSSDETPDVVKRFDDSRILFLENKGIGVSAARNTGIAAAQGEYIAYLDSDNMWTPYYLEYMMRTFLASNMDWAYAMLKLCDQIGDEYTCSYYETVFDYQRLKSGNFIDINVFMHKKALAYLYGDFDEQLKRFVDWDLCLRYCKNGNGKLNFFVGCLYNNEQRADRITHTESNDYWEIIVKKHAEDEDVTP